MRHRRAILALRDRLAVCADDHEDQIGALDVSLRCVAQRRRGRSCRRGAGGVVHHAGPGVSGLDRGGDALTVGHRLGRIAGVATEIRAVGEIAENHDLVELRGISGQDRLARGGELVVLEQHQRLLGHRLRQVLVRRALDDVLGDLRIRLLGGGIELAGGHAIGEGSHERVVDDALAEHALRDRLLDVVELVLLPEEVPQTRDRKRWDVGPGAKAVQGSRSAQREGLAAGCSADRLSGRGVGPDRIDVSVVGRPTGGRPVMTGRVPVRRARWRRSLRSCSRWKPKVRRASVSSR